MLRMLLKDFISFKLVIRDGYGWTKIVSQKIVHMQSKAEVYFSFDSRPLPYLSLEEAI